MEGLDGEWVLQMSQRIPLLENHGYCQECQEDFDWATCPHFGLVGKLMDNEVKDIQIKHQKKKQELENEGYCSLTIKENKEVKELASEKKNIKKQKKETTKIQSSFMMPSLSELKKTDKENLGSEYASRYLKNYRENILNSYLDNYQYVEKDGQLGIYIHTHRHCAPYDSDVKDHSNREYWTISIPVFPYTSPVDEYNEMVDHAIHFLNHLSNSVPLDEELTLFVTNGSAVISTAAFMNAYEHFIEQNIGRGIDIKWKIIRFLHTEYYGTTQPSKSGVKQVGYIPEYPAVNLFINKFQSLDNELQEKQYMIERLLKEE